MTGSIPAQPKGFSVVSIVLISSVVDLSCRCLTLAIYPRTQKNSSRALNPCFRVHCYIMFK